MSEGRISLADGPGNVERLYVKVLGPLYQLPVRGILVNQAVLWVETHFLPSVSVREKGRTLPHMEPREHCEGCAAGRPKRPTGYAGLWMPELGKFQIGIVTREAGQCDPRLCDKNADLRGLQLELRRMGRSSRAAVLAILGEPARPCVPLPGPLDVLAQLRRLWGISES